MIRYLLALCCLFSLYAHADYDYRVGSGDVVKIVVYDHPDLTTEAQLNADGSLNFPLVGLVRLVNLTTTQSEKLLASKLADGGYINHPNVNVLVTQYRSQRVSVVGEVYKPGRYPLDGRTDLIEMLATAGGISPTGGEVVALIHGGKRTEFVLSTLMTDSNHQRIEVANEDVIFVPRLQQVYVYGEVNRPGAFRLERNMNIMQALSLAGGYTPRASHRGIEIHRSQADGSIVKVPAKLTDLLQQNDVVFIEESLF